MLAKLVAEIPPGLYYEPKWDGFRAIVEKDGDAIEIHSRNGKPMARYFPDLLAAFRAQLPDALRRSTARSWSSPAAAWTSSRSSSAYIRRRAASTGWPPRRPRASSPSTSLRDGGEDLQPRPFRERRAALEAALAGAPPPLHVTPITRDEALAARWFERFEGAGLDGVIAKHPEHPYRPNARTMFKVKHQRTADCVVCGYRLHKTEPDAIGSLLLGLYADGENAPPWARVLRRAAPDRRDRPRSRWRAGASC